MQVNYAALLLVSAVCGYVLSPIHLCLLLTNEYFNANLLNVYRIITFPVLVTLFVGIFVAMF
ncbi:MAG: DUF401 family protein [bacterium]